MKLLFFALLACSALNAQESKPDDAQSPAHQRLCKDQIELYCKDAQEKGGVRGTIMCLIKNDDKLSVECKQEIQRMMQASRQTSPGGPIGAIGGLTGMGSQVPSVSIEGRFIRAKDDTGTPSLLENQISLSMPIYKNEADTYSATLSGGDLRLSKKVFLDSGKAVPENLYKNELGLQFSRKFSPVRNFGIRGSVGYTGDKMDSKTQIFNFSANYSYPGEGGGVWVWMVFLSNNSPLGEYFPIPGFFYLNKTDTMTTILGFPILSWQWTPVNPWAFSFSVFGPQVKTEASYGSIDKTQFFSSLGFKQQKYLISDRMIDNERLSIEEKTLEVGFRKPLFMVVYSEFQLGYSFHRQIYAGESLIKKDGGNLYLDSAGYLKWSLKAAF